ncbi:NrfD/PsrC family molybdoenzyme membrane anchor subunit [Chloroflexota bacterium]
MVSREWMVTHEWMVKPTAQTEWIERRGILVWFAEVFNSIGAGLFIVSLIYNNLYGMLIGWLIIVFLKLLPHLIYLGKPLRFWLMLPPFSNAWKTSWVSRGIIFTTLFCGFAFMLFLLTYFYPGTGWVIALKFLSGIMAFLTGIYSGFALSYCRSVPFWNSALLPLLFLFTGIADGFAFIVAISLFDTQVNAMTAEVGSQITLIVNIIIIVSYLWNATCASKTAKNSAMLLLRGSLALHFWVGVIVCGIVIPLAVSIYNLLNGEIAIPLLIIGVAFHTIGTFSLKYCLLKAGLHNPLLPVTTSNYLKAIKKGG